MAINLLYNPNAPQLPGRRGCHFECSGDGRAGEWEEGGRDEQDGSIENTLFVRIGMNRWVYLGQYEMKLARSITPDEWKQQEIKVKVVHHCTSHCS
jgi:hypothetical protein